MKHISRLLSLIIVASFAFAIDNSGSNRSQKSTDEKIIIATGFSGHGFKFVPAMGEILSKMARGLSLEVDLTFLSMGRFGEQT